MFLFSGLPVISKNVSRIHALDKSEFNHRLRLHILVISGISAKKIREYGDKYFNEAITVYDSITIKTLITSKRLCISRSYCVFKKNDEDFLAEKYINIAITIFVHTKKTMLMKLTVRNNHTAFAVLALLLNACSGRNDATKSEAIGNQTPGEPVEMRKQDAGYQPAFAEQFRAPGVKTTTSYNYRIITDKLNRPWGIVALPDGNFLVTEKEGTMRTVTAEGKVSDKIAGIPEVVSDGQGGLLGLVTDPDFAANRTVYWSFSEKRNDGSLTAVAKGSLSANGKTMDAVQVIYRATPAFSGGNHFGSRLVFDKNGHLYVTTGDRYEKERRMLVQEQNNGLGKIMRLSKDKKTAEVYSFGHRNVQGIAVHPETGDLWAAEFGPRGGDELNQIKQGKNYGWPLITYGIEYDGSKVGNAETQKEGMEQPVYFWDPVLSPSGMTFYSGKEIPEWKNNLFIGGLNSQHIARIVLKNNRVVGEERLLADQQQRFRAVTEGTDGALYAITDSGKLYRIGKQENSINKTD